MRDAKTHENFEKVDKDYVINAARAAKTSDASQRQRLVYVSVSFPSPLCGTTADTSGFLVRSISQSPAWRTRTRTRSTRAAKPRPNKGWPTSGTLTRSSSALVFCATRTGLYFGLSRRSQGKCQPHEALTDLAPLVVTNRPIFTGLSLFTDKLQINVRRSLLNPRYFSDAVSCVYACTCRLISWERACASPGSAALRISRPPQRRLRPIGARATLQSSRTGAHTL